MNLAAACGPSSASDSPSGSLAEMMTALVAESSWTDEELDALKAEIDRVRKEGTRS